MKKVIDLYPKQCYIIYIVKGTKKHQNKNKKVLDKVKIIYYNKGTKKKQREVQKLKLNLQSNTKIINCMYVILIT